MGGRQQRPHKQRGGHLLRSIGLLCALALAALLLHSQLSSGRHLAHALSQEPPLQQQQHLGTGTVSGSDYQQLTVKLRVEPDFPAPHLTHLVLVAGHAVYTGLDFALAANESSWFLEPYQQVPGEAQSFLDHIRLGVQAAVAEPRAALLLSGGQTRVAAGPRSEGLSYWMAAEAAGWWGHPDVRARAFTEEHARDSFENLLFSLCRFYEITGHYPASVTVVSYSLKQRRFQQLHRAALRYPADAFAFVGTPVPPAAAGAQAGEAATVAAFRTDPYGCAGSLLAKKQRRDPFAVGQPHPSRCPAMAALLRYCGSKPFAGPLPWDSSSSSSSSGPNSKQGLLPAGRRSSRSGIYT